MMLKSRLDDPAEPEAAVGTQSLAIARGVARRLAEQSRAALPEDVVTLARLTILDTVGAVLSGIQTPPALAALAAVGDEAGPAPVLGSACTLTPRAAALVNATAGHALDFDDCNLQMPGHVSVVIVPALFALLAHPGAIPDEADVVRAIVAGFEAGCLFGQTIAPGHYAAGFHATGTIGTLAAAGAVATLMGLDETTTAQSFAIAMTMAAGLKGTFGTMAKPLHAGRAAENGLLAVRLAAAGLETYEDLFERPQGFAATHAPAVPAPLGAAGGYLIRHNLFKFHAACYGTQAAIDCAARALGDVVPAEVRSVELETSETNRNTCSIGVPASSAEARFSLAHCIGMGAAGRDTADPAAYEETLADPAVVAFRDRVRIAYRPDDEITRARLTVTLEDGTLRQVEADAAAPPADGAAHRQRLEAKFRSLAASVIGADRAETVVAAAAGLRTAADARALVAETVLPAHGA
ncbi:MmgE/PrpD family protein [Acuticoccus mangrovi]|uniref:MmgE/PrpD family protein n=1 Tax=Acuticoccus mangrovi TaxID=2796142 RepID=A0A934ITI2_9HYPH|nr:MmgE/PrpD family protein [Acuticoccus mangrovi]MBJ3778536.1 MmgE/PrpD family protein [Acuticoccus mangrovi]